MFVGQKINFESLKKKIQPFCEWASVLPKDRITNYIRECEINGFAAIYPDIRLEMSELLYCKKENEGYISSLSFLRGPNEGYLFRIVFESGNVLTAKYLNQDGDFESNLLSFLKGENK